MPESLRLIDEMNFFTKKRKLTDEAKHALGNLPLQQATNNNVFVIEWFDFENVIYGYGCNADGIACRMKPDITPGLFVVSNDISVLTEVCKLHGYSIHVYHEIKYISNNFSLYDYFYDCSIAKPPTLVKIITKTVSDTFKLYYKFKNDMRSYLYVGVSKYWQISTQILFERLIKKWAKQYARNEKSLTFEVPDIFMHWFDHSLEIHDECKIPDIPIIVYDIETVSCEIGRIPDGSCPFDELYTASIFIHSDSVLYTIAFLPLYNVSHQEMVNMITNDNYKFENCGSISNVIECYSDECEMLKRVLELLTLAPRLHYLIGYNSISYDIKFILTRCVFYNIQVERFLWHDGFCFGPEQIHLDLYRTVRLMYSFQSYTLDSVCKSILKTVSKATVDAANLRFSFYHMKVKQQFLTQSISSPQKPSVVDTLKYNERDTILVFKLLEKIQAMHHLSKEAEKCKINVTTLMTNYNTKQYRLWNQNFVVGLNIGLFLTTFKSPDVLLKCPIYNLETGDITKIIPINLTLTKYLNNEEDDDGKFPGGFNFCYEKKEQNNVQVCDWVAAYPTAIDKLNISDETTSIIPANILKLMYPSIKNKHEFRVFDYIIHSGSSRTETVIKSHQYIKEKAYCGGEFELTLEELTRRQDAPIIIIWFGRRGLLSEIITFYNKKRAQTKMMQQLAERAYNAVQNKLQNVIQIQTRQMNHSTNEMKKTGPYSQIVNRNPYKFDFVNKYVKYISVNDSTFFLNDDLIDKEIDKENLLSNICDDISLEIEKLKNSHQLQKVIVSSFYGCLGMRTCMNKILAATITAIMRSTLLQSAQLCENEGAEICYADTDSLMFIMPKDNNADLTLILNDKFPFTKMDRKIMKSIQFVKTKVYYYINQDDGYMKYGQHVNGPIAWRECVEFFHKQTHVTTNTHIYNSFHTFFMQIYTKLLAYTEVNLEFKSHFTQTIKTKNAYPTKTITAVYVDYVAINFPSMANLNEHSVFYILNDSVTTPCLRPDIEITEINHLSKVNFYKYYQNVFTTIFYMLEFNVRKNNVPFNVMLSKNNVLLLFLRAFLDVYEIVFGV